MLDSKPLVSVVVPTFRRADKICRALDSIAVQSYGLENIEILVVNDNRPDSPESASTKASLIEYASIPRFRLLQTSGAAGGGAARNYACRLAKGKYLAFLDDDDEFLPDKIETQVDFMESRRLAMSWQDISWYDESDRLVEHRRLDHCVEFTTEGLLRAHLLTPIAPTAIYMMQRDLFERTDGFGEVSTGQDWWLMLRCIEAGAKMGYMPEVHVRQYQHSGARLSLGQNKIDGEVARMEKVRQYYPRLSKKDISYIEFRHNAVLAFACRRSGRTGEAARYAVKSFLASPAAVFIQGWRYVSSKASGR